MSKLVHCYRASDTGWHQAVGQSAISLVKQDGSHLSQLGLR